MEKQEERKDLEAKVTAAEQRLKTERDKSRKVDEQLAQIVSRLQSIQENQQILRDQLLEQEKRHYRSQAEHQGIIERLAVLELEKDHDEEEVSQLQTELSQSERELEALEDRKKEAEEDLAEAQHQRQEQENIVDSLQEKATAQQVSVGALVEKKEAARSSHQRLEEYAAEGDRRDQQLLEEKKAADAEAWLLKAHEHGIGAANTTLGSLYFNNKNYQKALKHLSAAQSAKAKHQLAQMYERGLGVKVNFYRSYMLYKEALKLGQKKAKRDVARLAKLKTGKEKAHFDAQKRKEQQQKKAFSQRFGEAPILRNLRAEGMNIHLQGLVSLPLQTSQIFIVNGEDGKYYYVIDIEQKANVRQYAYVDITAKATGNSITVSNADGLTVDVYQLYFQKHYQLQK